MRAVLQASDHRTFTGHLDNDDPTAEQLDTILSISKEEYDEVYKQAKEEVEDYNARFGPRDSDYPKKVRPEYIQKTNGETKVVYHITWGFRKWRLGDKVDIPRYSSDDTSELYGEATEDKEESSFSALTDYDYDMLYEAGPGYSKPSNGMDDQGNETFGLPEMDITIEDRNGNSVDIRQGSYTAHGKRGGRWIVLEHDMEVMDQRPRQMVKNDPQPKFVTRRKGDWFFAPKSWFDPEARETRKTEHEHKRSIRCKEPVERIEKGEYFPKHRRDWF
jgi:hypothetical protein